MVNDIYNKIYYSPKFVFMGEIEKNLEFILKDKIKYIFKIGLDLLMGVSKDNFHETVKELKENPELRVNSFQSIDIYKSGKKNFLIVNLRSFINDFSILLKIEISQKEMEKDCEEIIDILGRFYKMVKFYKRRNGMISENSDIKIFPQSLDGLDCFDLDVSIEDDAVKEAYIDIGISRVVSNDYYKGLGLYNLIAYISRFDWKAGIFPEVCLCSAFEELLQLKVTEKAQYIRMLLCELYRISNHIYFISNICNVLQQDIAYNFSLLERERVLRQIEAITGSRIVPNFIRIGGVKRDINEETIHNIQKSLSVLFKNIRRIEKIIMNDFLVIERLKNTGTIDKEIALEYGVSGPNLRASGIRYDLRKDKDPISYKDFSFTVPTGKTGDCLDRISIRFNEIFQSLRIIGQIINKFPSGDFVKKINLSHLEFQSGAVSYGIECPHGLFKIYIEVEKSNINSLVVKGPSINSLVLGEEILKGSKIEDINLILMILDISPGEIIST
jgi:NADH-quinone oxidoreductase subunit D